MYIMYISTRTFLWLHHPVRLFLELTQMPPGEKEPRTGGKHQWPRSALISPQDHEYRESILYICGQCVTLAHAWG